MLRATGVTLSTGRLMPRPRVCNMPRCGVWVVIYIEPCSSPVESLSSVWLVRRPRAYDSHGDTFQYGSARSSTDFYGLPIPSQICSSDRFILCVDMIVLLVFQTPIVVFVPSYIACREEQAQGPSQVKTDHMARPAMVTVWSVSPAEDPCVCPSRSALYDTGRSQRCIWRGRLTYL